MRRFVKCFTACFLAFILVFPGLAPAISWLEGKAARAQTLLEQPYMLEQAPLGDECTSGEWRYALRETDGYAVITGYDGDETCLTVPMQLDGADVVGLAPRALAGRQLKSIALHSNILTIAADAFGGETPEILAPNGSYALYYAQKHQLAWRTQQDYVLQPHVIDFSDALGGRISRRGDSHVLFAPLEGSRLEVGDIFWMFDARGVEYFYRVTALSWQDGSILASVERPAIAETIVELKLDNSVTLSEADFIPAEGVEVVSTQSRAGVDFGQEEKSVELELLELKFKIDDDQEVKLGVNYANKTTITYNAEVENEQLTAYSMMQEQISQTNVSLKYTNQIKKTEIPIYKNDPPEVEFTLGTFHFTTSMFFVEIKVVAGIAVTGEIEVSFKDYSYQIAEYNFATDEWEFADPVSSGSGDRNAISVSAEVQGKAYVKLQASVGLFEFVDVFAIEVEAGIKVALSATIISVDNEGANLPKCANLDIGFYAAIKIYVGLWVEAEDGDFTIGIKLMPVSEEAGPWPICNLHICFDSLENFLHFEEDCPFADSYKVTFETRTGETFDPIYVKKGDYAVWPPFYEMHPSETAGTFVGWATSAKATEPNWVLDDPNYPVTRSMTLYAIWDNMREVTFDSRGGSAVEAQSVPVGGYITRPQSPTKADNNFKYWYTLDDNNEISIWHFESDPMPDSSLTLYAEWDSTERAVNGTQYSMTIGSGGSVDCWQDTEKYFSYSLVKVDEQYIGVNINGLKNAPTHVRIPKNLIVDVNPASDEVEWKELPVLSVSSSMFRSKTNLIGVEFDFSGELSASSMFSGCTALEYADVSALPLSSIPSSMFSGCTSLKAAVFGRGIKSIDSSAFANCKSLDSVDLLSGIGSIGASAFSGCTGLTEVEFNEDLSFIGHWAFQNCTGLEELYIPDSVEELELANSGSWGPFMNCTGIRKISVGGVSVLKGAMLETGSSVLEELIIRGSVSEIADSTFNKRYCSTTTNGRLIIEEGLRTIGKNAFANCTLFTEVVLPSSLETIGDYAFSGCSRLQGLEMNDGPTTIGAHSFENCVSLLEVAFGSDTRTILESAFAQCKKLTQVTFNEGLSFIGHWAFQSCTGLEELYIPDSVEELELANSGSWGPFMNCTGIRKISVGGVSVLKGAMLETGSSVLEELIIRGSVSKIADSTFNKRYCSTTTNGRLIIEEGLRTIGKNAFANCTLFTEVVLPSSLETIGDYAFSGCSRLQGLEMNDGPTTIGAHSFENCVSLLEVAFGSDTRTILESAFAQCKKLTQVTFNEGLSFIGHWAFQSCTGLEELYIPDSVEELELANSGSWGPFMNCTGIRKISVGGVRVLKGAMLETGSSVLEELIIRGSVSEIADYTFSKRYCSTSRKSRLIIEEGVHSIGQSAFQECTLFTEVLLPTTLTNIGNGAFYGCSRLTHLRMGSGTPTISSSAFSGCSALGVYLTEENETVAGFFAGRNIPVFDAGDAGVSFTLTLQANGGLFADGTSVMAGEQGWYADLTSLPIPVNGQKLFCGWYMDENCTKPWILTEMPARDVTLYAGWDVDCWTLTLDLRGGALQGGNSLWVRAGSRPVDALIPVQEGRSFTGWYTDRYCTKRFDGVMPQADLKLYAGWTQTAANAEYAFDDEGATLVRYYLVEHENPALYLPETVEGLPLRAIAAGAFRDQAVEELWLPSGLTVLEEGALDGMAHLKAVKVHPNHPAFVAQDGVLFTADGQTLVHYPAARGTRYRIPSGVTAIGSHAFAGANLTNITWNDALVQIGDEAFRDTKLSSLEWKEGIVSIGQSAFAGTPLASVRLPRSLQTLGEKAFAHCSELQAAAGFEALVSIGSRAFEGCHGMLMLFGPVGDCALSAYAAENHHLYNYYSLTLSGLSTRKVQAGTVPVLPSRLALGENVRFTGWYMDSACTQPWPADGVMPAGNLTLYPGQEAVYTYETLTAEDGSQSLRLTGCSATEEEITIPSSIGGVAVTELAAGCFDHEIRLLRIPSCVQVIEEGAFLLTETLQIECQAQSAAESYAAAHGIAMVSPCYDLLFETNGGAKLDAQQYEAGETVELPVPVRDGYAFAGWFEDAALSIPAGADGALVMPAAQMTLYASWNLEDEEAANLTVTYEQNGQTMTITGPAEGAAEIVIPPAIHGLPVTAISPTAFRGQDTVISVVIPGSISAVPARAFLDCGALQSVVLEEGITQMEASAFAGCTSLHSVILPEGIDSIGSEAFRDSALVQLTLPASLRLLDASALDGCRKLERLECAMESAYFQTIDGVLYDRVDQALVKYPAARAGQTYTVPEGVCVIGAGAFAGASELASIELPQSLWEMGEGAFAGCVGLVQLPDLSSPQLYAIADHAFQGCYRLGSVEIPGNIGVVGSAAFAGCVNLTDALVPDSVSAIGRAAFGSQVRLTGSTGSAAHQYALENGLLFIDPTVSVLPQSISLSTEELLLHRGESAALTAELLPEGVTASGVTWYSSQPSVAIVNDGQVRALAAGSAVITAVSENGLSAECRITVDAAIPVDTVILSHDLITLCETKTAQMEAVVLPANATDPVLDWQSSDENVFTVDENGCLTAVHPGHAVLTVTASSGVSFQCEVHVKPRVSAIELQLPAVCQKGEAIPLQAVTQPADAFDSTLIWTVSGGGVIENGKLVIQQAGYYTITATAADLGTLCVSRELECLPDSVFTLPARLTTIGAEAFAGSTAEAIALPEGAASIGERAFANCTRLYKITIPASVNEIAADAFENANPVIITPANSYAEVFAMENGLDVRNP